MKEMKSYVKHIVLWTLAVAMFSTLIIGCGQNANETTKATDSGATTAPTQESTDAQLPLIGHAFTYDPNVKVAGGKDTEIEIWYHQDTIDPVIKYWFDAYKKIQPNVTLKTLLNSGDTSIQKLVVALSSGTGPDLFWHGNPNDSVMFPHMKTYNDAGFDVNQLKQDFDNVDVHVLGDGSLYYIDLGIMTAGIYYNKTMFADAGITELPKSWDQFIQVAKKLTKFDANGKMTVQGFGLKGQELPVWQGKMYMQGSYLFNEDSTPRFNTPESKRAFKDVWDCYYTNKISSRDFENFNVAMGNGQAAMIYSWAWVDSYFSLNFPDLKFGFFPMPTFDGKVPPAYDRQNGECTLGIAQASRGDRTEAAINFLRYVLADDDMIAQAVSVFGIAPTKKATYDDPRVKGSETITVEVGMIPRTVYPGSAPQPYWDGLQRMMDQLIVLPNMDSEDSIMTAMEKQTKKDMSETGFKQLERKYGFANELK